MADVLFEKVALIGLGLIGSSLGHAMKRAGIAQHITGHARSRETRQTALEIGFIDAVFEDMGQGGQRCRFNHLVCPCRHLRLDMRTDCTAP